MRRPIAIQQLILLASLLTILSACGTEIGNGWKVPDENNKPDKASNQQPATEADVTADAEDDNAGPNAGGASGTPVIDNESSYTVDLLFAECGSPFGDDIAQVGYAIRLVDSDTRYLARWGGGAWTFYTTIDSAEPYRVITPVDASGETLISTGGNSAPTGLSCQEITDLASDAIDDDFSYRSASVTIYTSTGEARTVKWYVHTETNLLSRIEITSEDSGMAVFQVIMFDEDAGPEQSEP